MPAYLINKDKQELFTESQSLQREGEFFSSCTTDFQSLAISVRTSIGAVEHYNVGCSMDKLDWSHNLDRIPCPTKKNVILFIHIASFYLKKIFPVIKFAWYSPCKSLFVTQ
jgi:hypothetical protein